MKIVSIIIDQAQLLELKEKYQNKKIDNNNEYIVFSAKIYDTIINIFKNNKNDYYKAVYMGEGALKLAKEIDKNATIIKTKHKNDKEAACWLNLSTQIGSDEVGTGDFFGPIVVTAAYVKESDIAYLRELGVNDSKKIDDDYILKVVPQILKHIDYSQVSVNNDKYNKLIIDGNNMNAIKARLHNQALLNLKKRHPEVHYIFIDQFCDEKLFYKYIQIDEHNISEVTFRMKGESAYPSVALASMIARYSFLQKIENINKKYKVHIPLGSGVKVDEFAKKYVKKYGMNELEKIVKKNFANYKRLFEENKLF